MTTLRCSNPTCSARLDIVHVTARKVWRAGWRILELPGEEDEALFCPRCAGEM